MKKIILILSALCFVHMMHAKKVHFMVDMSGQVKSPNGIHVMGDFQSIAGFGADWTPNTCQMTQDAMDTNRYHFTVDIPAFAKYEYKYINGDQSYEVEIVPLETQVGYNFVDNRWIYIDSLNADTIHLAPVLFGGNAPAGSTSIRFLVDMTQEPFDANGIHVAGSFQGNDPATHRLYSFGNNVFEIIAYLTSGSVTYKFYNGNMLSDAESVPASCASLGDRLVSPVNDTILGSVCFSGCSSCYPLSVGNLFVENDATLSPNPMQAHCELTFPGDQAIWNIAIVDQQGRYLRKYLNVASTTLLIERKELLPGHYALVMENNAGKRLIEKLIVN